MIPTNSNALDGTALTRLSGKFLDARLCSGESGSQPLGVEVYSRVSHLLRNTFLTDL